MKKITIKTLTLFMGLCAAVLLVAGCNKCSVTKPPHPPLAIDWENYNNAYDVYWNYATDCSIAKREDEGKIIKVVGWLVQPGGNLHEIDPFGFFYLTDKPEQIFFKHSVSVFARLELKEQLKVKFGNSDLTAKCYITGRLFFTSMEDSNCCFASPEICITNVDDIIFE